MKVFGLTKDESLGIRYIDTGLLYAFVSNFARGPEALRVFMASCHGDKNLGILGAMSLNS